MTNQATPPLLVLAGGFGTRLRTAIGDVPKPLAPVGDAPFLKYLVERWVEQGARRFVFLLHHHADQMIAFVEGERRHGALRQCDASWVVETTALGTGGSPDVISRGQRRHLARGRDRRDQRSAIAGDGGDSHRQHGPVRQRQRRIWTREGI
jgi:hypothetical protein